MRDVRYAVRALGRSPTFTLVAVLTLALGIGATTAIYAVLDALLIHPLPFPASERLVFIRQFLPTGCSDCYEVPIGNYPDLRRALQGRMDLVASRDWSPVLRGPDRTEVMAGSMVSPDFFRVLGAEPELGRTFAPDDSLIARREAVLSDVLWRRRFAADSTVVGRTITLDRSPFTVVGVIRAGDTFPPRTQVWAVLSNASALAPDARRGPPVDVFGRLRPGVRFGQAASAVLTVGAQLTAAYPEAMRPWRLDMQPLRSWHEDVRPALVVLMVAVGFLLVVACINLAGLLLVRFTVRARELTVRAALGASAGRIARQLFTEALLLSLAGAAVGVAFAFAVVPAIRGAVPEELASFEPGWPHMHVSGGVLAFAMALAAVACLLIGSGPAVRFSRPDLANTLKEAGRGSGAGSRAGRVRRGLVISQVALSLILLAAAGLLVRSIANMARADVGIRPDRLLTMTLERSAAAANATPPRLDFFDRLAQDIEGTPGVQYAGVVTALPLSHGQNWSDFSVEGRPRPRPEDRARARIQDVTPDYFATLSIPVVAGRSFDRTDPADTARVAVVNRALTQRFFVGEEPLGRVLVVGGRQCRIVGIVGNVHHDGPNEEPGAELYRLQRYGPERTVDLAVKTTGDPLLAAPSILAAVRRYDPALGINRVRTMTDIVAEFMSPYRLMLGLMAAFALLAVVISAVGLFGVVSYDAAQRTHEFGIRLALGAERRDIRRLVLIDGARLALTGAAIGVLGALGLTRLIRFLLYGIGAADPSTFLVVTILISLVVLVSTYIPARRATQVDPAKSLRAE